MTQTKESNQLHQHPMYFSGLEDFSEASEEKLSQLQEAKQDAQNEEIGWKKFSKSKKQIEKLKKQLLNSLVDYRGNLVESIQEICSETGYKKIDIKPLLISQQVLQRKNQEIQAQKQIKGEVDQKMQIIQKVLAERRIKKYYKSKYEDNFRDQLDPEDNQRQLYDYYAQIFAKNRQPPVYAAAPIPVPVSDHLQIQQPQNHIITPRISPPMSPKIAFPGRSAQSFAPDIALQRELSSPSNYNLTQTNNSKHGNHVNFLNPNTNHALNQSFMPGTVHDLSFDARGQNQFAQHHNPTQSFGFEESLDRMDVMSEGGNLVKHHKPLKHDDQMSHKDDIYKNFISKQNEQLMLQKQKVQQLTQKATKVLNNVDVYQSELIEDEQEADAMTQFKYMMGQIVDVLAVIQCLKFKLKFKSYDMVTKLYQKASEYYNQLIQFSQPLTLKYMSQIITAVLPEHSQQTIRIIIQNLFETESQISFEQFVQKLTSIINDHQYKIIEESLIDNFNTGILDLTVRLFDLWIQYHYFQQNIRTLLQKYSDIAERFIISVSEDGIFVTSLVSEFIGKSKKSKAKRLKVELFVRKIAGVKMQASQFYQWIETKQEPVNQSFEKMKEEEKYQYYYNLY